MRSAQHKRENLLCEQMPVAKGDVPSTFPYDKKSLGAFYTPSIVADLLSRWAIRHHQDKVLEPGFGGCEFLEAAVSRLKGLGCTSPQNQLVGCDIDPSAFDHLSNKFLVTHKAQLVSQWR